MLNIVIVSASSTGQVVFTQKPIWFTNISDKFLGAFLFNLERSNITINLKSAIKLEIDANLVSDQIDLIIPWSGL